MVHGFAVLFAPRGGAVRGHPWWLRGAGRSHAGAVREYNEDDFRFVGATNLAVVCDGMGGNCGGGPAAKTAVWTLVERYATGEGDDAVQDMTAAIQAAHDRVDRVPLPEITTTLAALHLCEAGPQVVIGHVGTCRVDRWRGAASVRLTADHSLVGECRAKGLELSDEDAERYAWITTRTLGLASHPPEIDTVVDTAVPGDLYLLTTGGLQAALTDDVIARMVQATAGASAHERPGLVVDALVEEALARDARSNVTACAVIVDVGGEPDPSCGRTTEPTVPWLYAPGRALAEPPERWRGIGRDAIAWYSEIYRAVMGGDE